MLRARARVQDVGVWIRWVVVVTFQCCESSEHNDQ